LGKEDTTKKNVATLKLVFSNIKEDKEEVLEITTLGHIPSRGPSKLYSK
jgi:hypothetical protein